MVAGNDNRISFSVPLKVLPLVPPPGPEDQTLPPEGRKEDEPSKPQVIGELKLPRGTSFGVSKDLLQVRFAWRADKRQWH